MIRSPGFSETKSLKVNELAAHPNMYYINIIHNCAVQVFSDQFQYDHICLIY